MRVLARGIKLPNVAAVQRSHDTDTCHHGRAVELDDQEQGFDGSLPLVKILLRLGKLLDIFGGILERDELADAGQRYRIVEGPLPARFWPDGQRRIPSTACAV